MVMSSLAFARACRLREEGSRHRSRCERSVPHPAVTPGMRLPPVSLCRGIFMGRRCGEQLTRTAFNTGVKGRGEEVQSASKNGFSHLPL